MPSDLAVNLVASLIAFLSGLFARTVYHRLRGLALRRNRERIAEQRQPSFTAPWLVDYYGQNGNLDDLYAADFGDRVIQVPFLIKPSWRLDNVSESELIEQSVPQRRATVSIDRQVLKRRGRYLSMADKSGKPWNDLIACSDGVAETDTGPRIQGLRAARGRDLSCGAQRADQDADPGSRSEFRRRSRRSRSTAALWQSYRCSDARPPTSRWTATFRCSTTSSERSTKSCTAGRSRTEDCPGGPDLVLS